MRLYFFLFFLGCVFLMGGGSRGDIQSLVLLRPISIVAVAYALIVGRPENFRSIGLPFFLLLALAVVMLVQLLPLPPSVWTLLPGRSDYADLAPLIGIEQPWRAISLSPARTINSLFSLSIPIAAMMLYAVQADAFRVKIIPAMMLFCFASALIAIVQISLPGSGLLYSYRITNEGLPVGLFANRNHQAVTMAALIVMGSWYFSSLKPSMPQVGVKTVVALGQIAIVIPLIFVAGSRAGLLLGALALVVSIYFMLRSELLRSGSISLGSLQISKKIFVGTFFALVALLIALVIFFSRTFALDRFLNKNNLVNQRAEITPYLMEMVRDFFPIGSGFGTFSELFKKYETVELLGPTYLNQAHNDWVQVLIESGAVGGLILLLFSCWIIYMAFDLLKSLPSKSSHRRLMALVVILIFGLASVVDYPLRTPIIMTMLSIFCIILGRRPASTRSG